MCPAIRYARARRSVILGIGSFPFVAPVLYPERYVVVGISSVLYLSLAKFHRCCCAVSPESPVFWRVSGLLRVSYVGPASCTVVDGVGPSPAASPAVAPGTVSVAARAAIPRPAYRSSRRRRQDSINDEYWFLFTNCRCPDPKRAHDKTSSDDHVHREYRAQTGI